MQQMPGYTKTSVCPFNSSHLILTERMQTHLVKCSRNYPEIILKKCPFNTTHLVKEQALEDHLLNCEDRMNYDLFKYNISVKNEKPMGPVDSEDSAKKVDTEPPSPVGPDVSGYDNCEESWDDEQVATYDPQAYVVRSNVIRTLNVAKPSEKKSFREAERLRLQELKEKY